MRMTKSLVPKRLIDNRLIDNRTTSNIVADLRRQRKPRSLLRIDGINSIFIFALVQNLPYGQSLNGKDIFIKIAPTIIVMIEFMK